MPKIVRVTPVQVDAAKLMVKLAAKAGKSVSPAAIAIANARRPAERAAS